MKKSEFAKKFFMLPISFIFGVLVLLTEFLFTLPSMIIWNMNNSNLFNPIVNWHSDLGNAALNAAGHYWYNTGQIVQAIAIIIFAGGLYILNEKRKEKIPIRKGQIFLILAGISLLISGGLYPETNLDLELIENSATAGDFMVFTSPHVVFSLLVFIFLSIGIGILAFKLRKIKEYRTVAIIGLIAFFINVIVLPLNIIFSPPIAELFAAVSAEIFVASLGIKILKTARNNSNKL